MKVRTVLLMLLLLIPHWGDTADWISIKVTPNGGFVVEGVTISSLIRVPIDPNNLSVLSGIVCESYEQSSVDELDKNGPASLRKEYKLQYEGTCRAYAVLLRREKTKLVEYPAIGPVIQVIGVGIPIF